VEHPPYSISIALHSTILLLRRQHRFISIMLKAQRLFSQVLQPLGVQALLLLAGSSQLAHNHTHRPKPKTVTYFDLMTIALVGSISNDETGSSVSAEDFRRRYGIPAIVIGDEQLMRP
jgi:hypothetical protein